VLCNAPNNMYNYVTENPSISELLYSCNKEFSSVQTVQTTYNMLQFHSEVKCLQYYSNLQKITTGDVSILIGGNVIHTVDSVHELRVTLDVTTSCQQSHKSVLPLHPSSQRYLQTVWTSCCQYSRLHVCVVHT